jgi:hypothetical protein
MQRNTQPLRHLIAIGHMRRSFGHTFPASLDANTSTPPNKALQLTKAGGRAARSL